MLSVVIPTMLKCRFSECFIRSVSLFRVFFMLNVVILTLLYANYRYSEYSLCWMSLSWVFFVLSVVILSILCSKCRYSEHSSFQVSCFYCYAVRHRVKCRHARCHSAVKPISSRSVVLDKCRDVNQIRWKYDASTLSSESVNLMVDKFLQTFLSAKEEGGGA